MIKFFRNIRKTNLKEGKAINYFKYAIGEIVLVVVGILIALGINNWNSQRNNKAQVAKHLETIRLNLQDDIKQADSLLHDTQTTGEYANTFFGQFKTNLPIDNNIQLYMLYLMFERNIEVNKSGFDALLNSNGMSFVDEYLQIKILDYYRLIEQLKSREENANTEIKTMYEPYVKTNYYWLYNKTNPWPRQVAYYKDDPRPIEDIHEKLASVIADKRLEMMVVSRIYQAKMLSGFYSKAIKVAKEIISEIEKTLKN
jgi:hypothetical protein